MERPKSLLEARDLRERLEEIQAASEATDTEITELIKAIRELEMRASGLFGSRLRETRKT